MPSGRKGKKPISEEQLASWSLLSEFRSLLGKIPSVSQASTGTTNQGGPKRLLTEEDYLSSFLFAQFNPVLDSMRGLCACTKFPKFQQQVSSRPISLGSFSEAQSVFGYERVEQIFTALAQETIALAKPTTAHQKREDGPQIPPVLLRKLRLVDSSVFHALPRMSWAHWRSGQRKGSAVRLHLKFRLWDKEPDAVSIGTARVCERKAFKTMVEPGDFYVGDRNYGRDYKLLAQLVEADCGFVIRICEQASITVREELPLTEEDRQAGVVSDQIVRLGAAARWHFEPVRLIRVEKPELDEPLLIVSSLVCKEDASAALVAEIYRTRWEIELFFRWLKCIYGRPKQWHWFAESPEGVGIQMYCALIASLLLARRLGKLPSKRMTEMIRWHQLGMISEEDLEEALKKEAAKNCK